MSSGGEGFRASYSSAFRDYLLEPCESALRAAYELGREAVSQELSVLDLALVHQEALLSELREVDSAKVVHLAREAGDFFLESLSAYEMVQRGFREARDAALIERRHAEILRQLSSFLTDASLALDASDSIEEMLQLVAEQARDLVAADGCLATVALGAEDTTIEAGSRSPATPVAAAGDSPTPRNRLVAPLTALDGRQLGSLQLFDKQNGEFTAVDQAVLVHLAQMASAAVERAGLYRAHDAVVRPPRPAGR